MVLVTVWVIVAATTLAYGLDYYLTPLVERPFTPQHELLSLRDERERTGSVANDYTFIFAGGELPTKFLRECGVEIDTKFGEP